MAGAAARADGRARARADRDSYGERSAAEVVAARDDEAARASARSAADPSADERAFQTVPAAADLQVADAVARERHTLAVVREVDGLVGRVREAARQTVAVLCADGYLCAGRDCLNVRPFAACALILGRGSARVGESEDEREDECEKFGSHVSLRLIVARRESAASEPSVGNARSPPRLRAMRDLSDDGASLMQESSDSCRALPGGAVMGVESL